MATKKTKKPISDRSIFREPVLIEYYPSVIVNEEPASRKRSLDYPYVMYRWHIHPEPASKIQKSFAEYNKKVLRDYAGDNWLFDKSNHHIPFEDMMNGKHRKYVLSLPTKAFKRRQEKLYKLNFEGDKEFLEGMRDHSAEWAKIARHKRIQNKSRHPLERRKR